MRFIVEPERWDATYSHLGRQTGLPDERLVLEVTVSLEGARLVVTSRSGKAIDLDQHLRESGCSASRQVFLSVRAQWAFVLLDAKLRDPEFAAKVFGIFLDSAWVLQRNNPKFAKCYDQTQTLPRLLAKSFLNIEGSQNIDYAGTVAGVVWHPAHNDEFRSHAIRCAQLHPSLIYCIPHGLSFALDPEACFQADTAAMEWLKIDPSTVIVMASQGHEHRWTDRFPA